VILIDTSVWVDHLRNRNPRLVEVLNADLVLTHPFVIGELMCGNMRRRSEVLGLLAALPGAASAQHEEVLELVTSRRLHGRGIGWIDAHLLASALITGCTIWSLDRALHALAVDLAVSPAL